MLLRIVLCFTKGRTQAWTVCLYELTFMDYHVHARKKDKERKCQRSKVSTGECMRVIFAPIEDVHMHACRHVKKQIVCFHICSCGCFCVCKTCVQEESVLQRNMQVYMCVFWLQGGVMCAIVVQVRRTGCLYMQSFHVVVVVCRIE